MALASTYDGKLRVINDILDKTSADERKIMLQMLIKKDMKAYFEVIWDEQKRLETEAGVEGVCEFTSEKAWADGEEIEQNEIGLEVNLAGKPSKEAENAYYLDEKPVKNDKNDKFDGFLGYVNSSGNDEIEDQTVLETTLEPGEFIDKIADKIAELEMKTKMKNMKFPNFGDKKEEK